nr:hypothetical protein [uncultured Fluviicola sp.]
MSWISYVGFTLVEGSSAPPTPENAFSQRDDTIIVVHNPSEIDYTSSIVSSLQKNSFFTILLNQPERIQHFYFSTSQDLVLLERSKPWTSEIVKNYVEKLALSSTISTQKHISLSNNWKGEFHGKYLLLYLGEWKPASTSIVSWKYLDRKSSLSLVYRTTDNTYEIEDSYFISDYNTTKSITHTGTEALPLINDQELFQELIPGDFDAYTFYEKNYLLSKFPKKSLVYDWMDFGLTLVVNQKDSCLITDYKPGQDPLAILSDLDNVDLSDKEKQATLKGHFFPFLRSDKKIYLELFNNSVLISNSQQSINRIIGAYETGATLEQSTTLKFKLFSNSPQKVSYRHFDRNQQITLSRLTGANHGTIQLLNEEESDSKSDSKELPKLNPLRLDDNLRSLSPIPGSNNLVAITLSNTLYFIGSKQIIWSKNLESEPIGNPVFIGNGLFLTTKSGVQGFDRNGNNLAGFPIVCNEVTSNLFSYYWNGKDFISFIADGQIQSYGTNGKQGFRIGVNGPLQKESQLVIQGKKGELIAHVCTNSNWSSISIKRKRLIKSNNLNEGEWHLVKVNSTISLLGLVKKQFIRMNENGNKTMLVGNVSTILNTQNYGEEKLFFLNQQGIIYVITSSGTILSQFNSTIGNIDDATIIRLPNNKTLVGIIDGIANNCYIYSTRGNELNKESYEGSNKIVFQKQTDGTILLVSQANGYLIRYPLNY